MKKIIILSVVLFCNWVAFGQDKNEKIKEIKIIEWDYHKKTFKDNKIFEKLRVNDVVQIQLINMPSEYEITSNLTFINNHLELRGDFGKNIAFNQGNENTKTPPGDSEIQKSNNLDQKDIKAKDIEKLKSILNDDSEVNKLKNQSKNYNGDKKKIEFILIKEKIEKTNKINADNLHEALEINIAKDFIKNKEENLAAIEDLEWQKKLILIAQKNWKAQLDLREKERDSIVNVMNKQIDTLSTEITSLYNTITEKDKEINKLKSVQTHYFTPFKIENFDFTEINFNISVKKDKVNERDIEIPVYYSFKNKGGFKLDFSTGILATGLYSPTYKFYTTDNKTQIKEEANVTSKFNTGIALMAHAYRRSGNYLCWGLGSGFSYNLDSQNLNYLIGGSLLWGEEQRIITSIGLNVGKVKELPKYYKIDTDYDATEFSSNAVVPTVDVLKASWFLSITYNLGVGNSSKRKSL